MNTIIVTKKYKPLVYLLLLLTIVSCSAPKDVSYFQGIKNLEEINITNKKETTYKPQDIISIHINAEDAETALPFNTNTNVNTGTEDYPVAGTSQASKYLIDANGMIEFPVIGSIKVADFTSFEVKELLKQKLKKYIKNPIVSVKLENFTITVLGEVNNPGPVVINNERVTIIEAIGLAKDLNIKGKRENITVIRTEGKKQTAHKVDLTSKDIFNSPVYYLAQNDVVYVEPNTSRKKESRDNQWSRILTSTSSILGIVISIILLTR